MPALPKGLVQPTVVAGLYGVGRGQDKAALIDFVSTLGQAMGPEALQKFVNPTEFIKRLAAASGIDYLNLIKSPETMEQEMMQAQQMQMGQSLVGQAGQLAKSPMGEALTQQMMENDGSNTEAEAVPEASPEA